MAAIAGKLQFSLNGRRFASRGSFKVNLGEDVKEPLVSLSGDINYKVQPQAAMIEGNIDVTPELDVQATAQAVDGTVTLEAASGKVYTLREAFFAAEGEIDADEGTMAAKFVGRSMDVTNAA